VVECGHPSPLSARFFMGCRCFSKIDAHLTEAGLAPMSWQIADV
jgi:uracil-DNA glycosylase